MTAFLAVKVIHVACVAIGGLGFLLRGFLLAVDAPSLKQGWPRTVVHVNDTLLLLAAIALAIMTGRYPFVDNWLTAKVLALVAYIILGSVALKAGRTKPIRLAAWLGALALYAYVISVALLKNPLGFLAFTGGGG